MHRSEEDQLRNKLSRQLQMVTDALLHGKGEVSDDQMVILERLARVTKLSETAKLPRKRWPVLTLLVFILLTLSVLLFCRISQTEIEMDIEASEVGFVLSNQQVIIDVTEVSFLGVSGLKTIRLPRARRRVARDLSDAENAIRLSPGFDEKNHGTVTLAAMTLPADTRVRVSATESLQQHRLSLKGENIVFRATVSGSLRVGLSSSPVEQHYYETPKSILLYAGSNDVDLDLAPFGASALNLQPQLSITELTFSRIDEYLDVERTVIRRISTILSGSVYFNELNDQKRLIRPGEMIRFNKFQGKIRSLQMHDGKISLKFHGSVRGMRTGSEDSGRSLMPTYLDWLHARHSLALLWGTTLYFFGIVLGILRWWGIRL
jgi:hypothetical protein